MSETLLAIDPGIRGAGVALFNGAELVVARYVKNACPVKAPMAQRISCLGEEIGHMQPPRVLVTECPQIYIFGKGKGNPNDLVRSSARSLPRDSAARTGCSICRENGRERWTRT